MSIGAAVNITSSEAGKIIAAACLRAQQLGQKCFVISVVHSVGDRRTPEQEQMAAHNLGLIMARSAAPIVQEADDVPRAILSVARYFGIETMFVGSPRRRAIGRSVVEKLVRLSPPFEIVVVKSDAETNKAVAFF